MKGFSNFFTPSRSRRHGGYVTYPTSAGYQVGLYPPNTTYAASPTTYGTSMMPGPMPVGYTAVHENLVAPQGVGTAQYEIPQAPGSAAVTYGGVGNAQYGYLQGQQTATSVAQGQQGARPAFTPGVGAPAQAEIERSTASTYDGSGNVQQTVTQEEQVSSSVPATAQMGNPANPAIGGLGSTQYGVPQGQQVPMPGSALPGMPNLTGYQQYGSYPVPVGSTNLSISLPPSGGNMTGYRSPTPPKGSRSRRSRSIPPTLSQSSPRTSQNTRCSNRVLDRDGPVSLPPDYVPTSSVPDDQSRGIGHHHSHHHHGPGRHRSSSQSNPNSGYLSPPRPAYSRQRSRSVDDLDMQRSRATSGGYYSPRGVPQPQSYPYQNDSGMPSGISSSGISSNSPAVVQQSRSQPVMLPIDNGRGGWLVVPPRGTNLRVMDPSQVTHGEKRSRHYRSTGAHSHTRARSGSDSPSFFSQSFSSGRQKGCSSRAAQVQPVQSNYIYPPRSKHHRHQRWRGDCF